MKNIRKYEVIHIALIFFILLIGVCTDAIFSGYIPDFMIMKSSDAEGLSLVLFQVQSTVATLGIALISILSSSNNEMIYGVSISQFILQIRPKVLKHRNILIAILSLIAIDYVFVAFQFRNSVVSVFFVTLYLIVYILIEILDVFNGRVKHTSEIGAYIKNNSSNFDVTNSLFEDTLVSIERTELIRFSENSKLIVDLIGHNAQEIENIIEYKSHWENNIKEIFARLLSTPNEIDLKITYKLLKTIYDQIIKNFERPEKFVVWDAISTEFFKSLNRYQINSEEDLYIFTSIRSRLYETLYMEKEDGVLKRNNYLLEYIYPRVYWLVFRNNSQLINISMDSIESRKVKFFETIFSDIRYKTHTISDIQIQELLLYTKAIIDNAEIEVLNKTLKKQINIYNNISRDNVFNNFIFIIIIYIYYLSEKENLVNDNLKNKIIKFRRDNIRDISDFIYINNIENDVNKNDIKAIKETLSKWEYMPEDSAKYLVMDSCVDLFLIMSTMYLEKHIDFLKKRLEPIILGNSFLFVNQYTGIKGRELKEEYTRFVKNFFGKEISEDEATNDIIRFESVLYELYRLEELKEGREKAISHEKLYAIKKQLKESIEHLIYNDISIFSNQTSEEETKEDIFEFTISTYTDFIESNSESDASIIRSAFIRYILRMFMREKQVINKEINFRNKNILTEFFNLVENAPYELNTLIGYRDWFYGYEGESRFKEIENSSNKINIPELSNIVVYIAGGRFSIEIIDVDVHIEELDTKSFMAKLKRDDEGKYLYNITNDIYLPFGELELKELIELTRKQIIVKIPYRYSFAGKSIGVAIIHKNITN